MTMSEQQLNSHGSDQRRAFDAKLAGYLAATGAWGTFAASGAEAEIVGSSSVIPFGVNEAVDVDFNSDGQVDFQIDHDRVNVNGTDLDYLQIDKNDVNGAANPLDFDPIAGFTAATFPPNGTVPNNNDNAGYVIDPNMQGAYPAALSELSLIGPGQAYDYQESESFQSGGKWIRANRLIDEDATQIDQVLGGQPASGVQVPFNGPNFVGLGGETRYVGLRMQLNGNSEFNYGWIGVEITNEDDATGNVVGWAYQTTPGVGIPAGIVPEPTSMVMAAMGGLFLGAGMLSRKIFRTRGK